MAGLRGNVSGDEVIAMIRPGAGARKHKELLVYIHVPFCTSKCHFCDWVVNIDTKDLIGGTGGANVRARYADAVARQIRWYGPRLSELGYRVTYVYWGGGTPSKLTVDEMRTILSALRESFSLDAVVEHSVEASPETLTPEKLAVLHAGGANRVSMGVQSFDEATLRKMGRAHSSDLALRGVDMIREAGFPTFNIDLIAAFPDQNEAAYERTLDLTVERDIPHVTLYPFRALVSAKDTVAASQIKRGHRRSLVRDEVVRAFELGEKKLIEAGYTQYTVGYFAKGREHVFHAENYFLGFKGDFVGFGDGAHSFLGRHVFKHTGSIFDTSVVDIDAFIADPTKMAVGAAVDLQSFQPVLAKIFAWGFQTGEGIVFDHFEDHFGLEFAAVEQTRVAQNWLRYYAEKCGARFERTSAAVRVDDTTRALAHVSYVAAQNDAALG